MILQNVHAYIYIFFVRIPLSLSCSSRAERERAQQEMKKERKKDRTEYNLAKKTTLQMCNGAYGPRPSKCDMCNVIGIWLYKYVRNSITSDYFFFRNTKLSASLRGIYRYMFIGIYYHLVLDFLFRCVITHCI